MSGTHFKGPVHSANGFLDGSGNSIVTGADLVAITSTAAEIDVLAGVTPGTAANSKAVVLNSSKGISTITSATITTLTSTTVNATAVNPTTLTVAGTTQFSFAAITAGVTQTQAGATAITTDIVQVTTGTAGDGLRLPALTSGQIGRVVRIINASANAGTVYGTGTTSTNTIDGTAGATGVTYAASKTLILIAVSATAWVSTLSN